MGFNWHFHWATASCAELPGKICYFELINNSSICKKHKVLFQHLHAKEKRITVLAEKNQFSWPWEEKMHTTREVLEKELHLKSENKISTSRE